MVLVFADDLELQQITDRIPTLHVAVEQEVTLHNLLRDTHSLDRELQLLEFPDNSFLTSGLMVPCSNSNVNIRLATPARDDQSLPQLEDVLFDEGQDNETLRWLLDDEDWPQPAQGTICVPGAGGEHIPELASCGVADDMDTLFDYRDHNVVDMDCDAMCSQLQAPPQLCFKQQVYLKGRPAARLVDDTIDAVQRCAPAAVREVRLEIAQLTPNFYDHWELSTSKWLSLALVLPMLQTLHVKGMAFKGQAHCSKGCWATAYELQSLQNVWLEDVHGIHEFLDLLLPAIGHNQLKVLVISSSTQYNDCNHKATERGVMCNSSKILGTLEHLQRQQQLEVLALPFMATKPKGVSNKATKAYYDVQAAFSNLVTVLVHLKTFRVWHDSRNGHKQWLSQVLHNSLAALSHSWLPSWAQQPGALDSVVHQVNAVPLADITQVFINAFTAAPVG